MARIIKTYPPTPQFNEDIIAQADKIQDIFMPEYSLKSFTFSTSENEVITLQTTCYALEDSKGVHIRMAQKNQPEDTKLQSKEVVMDEIEFCDAVYHSVERNERLSNNPKIKEVCQDILDDFCISPNRGNRWFFDISYKGFGVILGGIDVIATIDTVIFKEDHVELIHCVGNYNLNNVEDCVIQFWSYGKGFILSKFQMNKVTNEEEGCCTYNITVSEGHDTDDTTYQKAAENRSSYDQGVEQFIEDRLAYIEECTVNVEEKDSIYDLL